MQVYKIPTLLAGPVEAVIGLITGGIPQATEKEVSRRPMERSRDLTRKASAKAAAVSGTLSLPVGPLGFMTILPDLAMVWRIQSQLVVDIAAAYGHTDVTQAEMTTCLFRHVVDTAQQEYEKAMPLEHPEPTPSLLDYVDQFARGGGRDLTVRVSRQIGQALFRRTIKRAASRVLPVAGAAIVSAYAALDTKEVARTAVELFSGEKLPARHSKKRYPSAEEMFQLNNLRDIQTHDPD